MASFQLSSNRAHYLAANAHMISAALRSLKDELSDEGDKESAVLLGHASGLVTKVSRKLMFGAHEILEKSKVENADPDQVTQSESND